MRWIGKHFLPACALLLAAVKLVEYYMPLVGPVCWLIVFPGSAVAPENRTRCARLFLASVAVFQILQAFPVQGSQTAWSTLLLSMCCVLLLHDGMMELSWRPTGIPRTVVVLVKLVAALTFSVPLM